MKLTIYFASPMLQQHEGILEAAKPAEVVLKD